MKKYNALYKEYKEALNENVRLKKENDTLKAHRKVLTAELEKTESQDKNIGEVFDAFSNNLVKSFKAKNVINMNEDERNAVYYMLEQYIDFVDLLKANNFDVLEQLK